MSSPILEASGLSAGYAVAPVIVEVNLAVSPGEIVCLLGPNGAGKTTTLLTLAGALAPRSGEVRWEGKATRSSMLARARRGLAYVTEERSLFMGLTAEQNLRLGRGSVEAALELMPELRALLKRRAGLLSGGEQQILTLARALAGNPRVLLADELSMGLAPLVVGRLLQTLKTAAQHRGVGVLLVEQHVRKALTISDRAYVLNRGRVVIEGESRELRDRLGDVEAAYLSGVAAP